MWEAGSSASTRKAPLLMALFSPQNFDGILALENEAYDDTETSFQNHQTTCGPGVERLLAVWSWRPADVPFHVALLRAADVRRCLSTCAEVQEAQAAGHLTQRNDRLSHVANSFRREGKK